MQRNFSFYPKFSAMVSYFRNHLFHDANNFLLYHDHFRLYHCHNAMNCKSRRIMSSNYSREWQWTCYKNGFDPESILYVYQKFNNQTSIDDCKGNQRSNITGWDGFFTTPCGYKSTSIISVNIVATLQSERVSVEIFITTKMDLII